LIRQYLPKGKSFDNLTDQDVQNIMDRLNNRPRKCLGFRTPNQIFSEAKSDVALASLIRDGFNRVMLNFSDCRTTTSPYGRIFC